MIRNNAILVNSFKIDSINIDLYSNPDGSFQSLAKYDDKDEVKEMFYQDIDQLEIMFEDVPLSVVLGIA